MPIPPSEDLIDEARDLANRLGIRILPDGAIGVWSEDKDSKQLQTVLDVLGLAGQPVLMLDGPGVPDRFKLLRGKDRPGMPFKQWRAERLNRLFEKEGRSGEPAHLTAKTLAHGLVERED